MALDYKIVGGVTTSDLTDKVKAAIKDGWAPLPGGFSVENFQDTTDRFLQVLVKDFVSSQKISGEVTTKAAAAARAPSGEPSSEPSSEPASRRKKKTTKTTKTTKRTPK